MASTSGSGSGDNSSSSGAERGGQQVGSSSGYSADKESCNGVLPPPSLIDLNPHKNRRKSQQQQPQPLNAGDEAAKRRKIHEENYDATLIRADLERAGHVYPAPHRVRPRINPNIDISSVRHFYSSDKGEKSPFLHEPVNPGTYEDLTDFGQVYMDLLAAARPFYDKPVSSRGVNARGVSRGHSRSDSPDADAVSSDGTTSSVSDNESDDNENSIQVINARLDDGMPEATEESPQPQRTTQIISCPASSSLSMEEAVGVCDFSR